MWLINTLTQEDDMKDGLFQHRTRGLYSAFDNVIVLLTGPQSSSWWSVSMTQTWVR
jgi:hypothetical protein